MTNIKPKDSLNILQKKIFLSVVIISRFKILVRCASLRAANSDAKSIVGGEDKISQPISVSSGREELLPKREVGEPKRLDKSIRVVEVIPL